jgi:YD repeat-containing protein
MGAGWTHTYDRSIHLVQGSPTPMVRAPRGDGAWRTFVRDDASSTATSVTWRDISPRDSPDRLTQKLASNGQTTSWVYRPQVDDSVETYDANGRLQSIMARNGGVTTLVYSTATTPPSQAPRAGLLLTVRNPFGRALNLSYDSAGRVASLTTPGGELVSYTHDALGNLTAVTTPNTGTNTSATQYLHYEDGRSLNVHALTGRTDALGVRVATYTYDDLGQVASTEKAQGLEKLTFQFSSPVGANSVIFYTPAPDAASTATLYGFSSLAGVLRPTSVSTPCPLCGASAAATDYDANQRKSRVVAHDGRVTFYTYNAKGRVTREATYPASYQSAMTAPPLGAAERVSSTQWHGTWNLPLKVAEAYLITSYSYDARGNLLEMVETPTTDTTGARGFNATPSGTTYTTRWTYDANNLPTTIVELEGSTETGRWDMTYNPTGDLTLPPKNVSLAV